jgi:3,4-dihydroxy 2-butanone 4-phosphate synthase/GTP cyclohydrolase II
MLDSIRKSIRLMLTALRGKSAVHEVATARLPTDAGEFDVHAYESAFDGLTHLALVCGDVAGGEDVLARVHSSCLTGDVFHSTRCDCGSQLRASMERIAEEGRGVILYLNQEGRGIGLANKIKAYALQDQGYDTVEANERLGFKADHREYVTGTAILRALGVRSVRLLSNNPRKVAGVTDAGFPCERLSLEIPASDANRRYLTTKKEKLGHQLTTL